MDSRLQKLRAISEVAQAEVAVVTEQAAYAPRLVTVVNGERLAVRRGFANRADLKLQDLRDALKSDVELIPVSAKVFREHGHSARRASPPFSYAVKSAVVMGEVGCVKVAKARVHTVLARISATVRRALLPSERVKGLDFPTVVATLFGYTQFSHGVNLSNRFTKWRGSLRCYQHLSGPLCILPQVRASGAVRLT